MIYTLGGDAPQGWIAWLISGLWWHILLKMVIPVALTVNIDLLTCRMQFTVCEINEKIIASMFSTFIKSELFQR